MKLKQPLFKAVCSNQDHFSEDLLDKPETKIIESNTFEDFVNEINDAFESGYQYVYVEKHE